jgi:hypothetical protein
MGAPSCGAANYGAATEPPPCMTTSMRTLPCRFRFCSGGSGVGNGHVGGGCDGRRGGWAAGSSGADWGGAWSIGVASGWEGSMVAVVGRGSGVHGWGGEISSGGSDGVGKKGKAHAVKLPSHQRCPRMQGTLGSAPKPASLCVWLTGMRMLANFLAGRVRMLCLDVPRFLRKTAY